MVDETRESDWFSTSLLSEEDLGRKQRKKVACHMFNLPFLFAGARSPKLNLRTDLRWVTKQTRQFTRAGHNVTKDV